MYFTIINIILLIFFLSLLFLGIKIKIWSYIPVNTIGIITCIVTILLNSAEYLDKIKILILLAVLVSVFIINFIITMRDIKELEDERKEISYLTSPYNFEYFKIIADERLIKSELDKNLELSIKDRLQALESWKLGNRAYYRKNFQEALEKYDLSNNWVNTSLAYINQSGVLIKLKQYEAAINYIERALRIDNNIFEAYMNYGVVLLNIKRNNDALQKFEQAININPESFDAWFCCGNLYLKLQEFKKAIECFTKSIQQNNQYYEAWYYKGITFENINENEQALKCFEQVIKINQKHYQAYYHRGNILHEMELNEDAIKSYNYALKINSDSVDVWNNRGMVFRKLGKYKNAIRSYHKALKINPKFSDGWLNCALAQDSLNKQRQALLSYQKFIEFAPPEKEKYIKITKKRISEIQKKYKIKHIPTKKYNSPKTTKPLGIQFADENNVT